MKKMMRLLLVFILLLGIVGCGTTVTRDAVPVTGIASEKNGQESGTEGDSVHIEEDGSYDTAPEVSLYLVTYHKLPGNYITKEDAKKLGWKGGSLEEFSPGKCIGGDVFYNREGLLPKDHRYHECDIESIGKSRGAKRLVYSEDFDVYYTNDHYQSFTRLY